MLVWIDVEISSTILYLQMTGTSSDFRPQFLPVAMSPRGAQLYITVLQDMLPMFPSYSCLIYYCSRWMNIMTSLQPHWLVRSNIVLCQVSALLQFTQIYPRREMASWLADLTKTSGSQSAWSPVGGTKGRMCQATSIFHKPQKREKVVKSYLDIFMINIYC